MNRSKQLGVSKFSQHEYFDDAASEKSISQSMVEIQRKQSGITGIIKLFSVFVLIIGLIIGYKIYLQQQPVDQKQWIQKEIQELIAQKDKKTDGSSNWYW